MADLETAAACLWTAYQADRTIGHRNHLVCHYWPLACDCAARQHRALPARAGWSLEDLKSVAGIGLIAAVERFDGERGVRFTTFAARRIQGAMLDALRDQAWQPRLALQARTEVPLVLQVQFPPAVSGRPGGAAPLDFAAGIADHRCDTAPTDVADFWRTACRGLGKVERLALLLHYREGQTMQQVSVSLALSESRVSQLLAAVRRRIAPRFEDRA